MANKIFKTPPNIILILTDQLRNYQHWGGKIAPELGSTKWFQKNNTIHFSAAMNAASMCSPSRATFWTSSYACQNGVIDTSQQELKPDYPNLFHYMAAKGYDVEYRGKWHIFSGQDENPTSTTGSLEDWGASGWDPPDGGLGSPESLGGGSIDDDGRYLYGGTYGKGPFSGSNIKANGILGFLNQFENKKPDNPFLLVASFVNPHDIMDFESIIGTGATPLNHYGYTYQSEGISLPQNQQTNLDYKPRSQQELSKRGPASNLPNPAATHYVNFYAQLTKIVDAEVTTLLERISALSNISEDTLIIRFADHGEQALSHLLREKAGQAYEETINIPLYFSHPDLTNTPAALPQVVSLLDLVPTIAETVFGEIVTNKTLSYTPPPNSGILTWTETNYPLQGQSLAPLLANPSPTTTPVHPNGVVFCYDDEWGNWNVRCLRTDTAKYVIYVNNDPGSDSTYPNTPAGPAGPAAIQQQDGTYIYECNSTKSSLGPYDYELYNLTDQTFYDNCPTNLESFKPLLEPSLGQGDQEVNNLANPNLGFTVGQQLTSAQVILINEWNSYLQPFWTQLHNQLLNQMLAVNAMPPGKGSATGPISEYVTNAEWITTGQPPQYASPTGWPFLVTPSWMIDNLTPTPFQGNTNA